MPEQEQRPQVIYAYTQRQAFEDGYLVDMTQEPFGSAAKQLFVWPFAMTRTAFTRYVDLDKIVDGCQDIEGRWWDILFMLSCALRRSVSNSCAIELSNRMIAWVDHEDARKVAGSKWHYDGRYATRNEPNGDKTYMHHVITPLESPGEEIDHRDGDTLNNRRSNHRRVSHGKNMQNVKTRVDSTSGYRGVSWEEKTQKWRARLRCEGLDLSLGRFISKEEAMIAYGVAAKEYFGAFRREVSGTLLFVFYCRPNLGTETRYLPNEARDSDCGLGMRKITLKCVPTQNDEGQPSFCLLLPEED